ncbi:MAG TPA: alkaline phosphatase family protein [Chryseosolibacter sp.]|nr:alkaline phosphatase family protein [Chryseosolibacter sp.]
MTCRIHKHGRLLSLSFSILFVASCSCFLLSCAQANEAKEETPKALFIILDGISADVIEKVNPPALAEIAKAGGYTRAYVGGGAGTYSETPTISAVGYNSLLTGTWVNKHNVWDNDIEDPNYHYKTIFSIAEEYKPELQTAIFSTWTDNRTKLVGEGLPQTKSIKLDYHFDGLEIDTIQYPHDDHSDYIHRIDELVADEAARYVTEKGPDLSWVYLQYTDDMGHRHGDSEKFYDAIRMADKQVGRIWDAIKEREKKFDEDWLIVITTDHGRDSTSGKHHGGQSPRERLTWIYTNADDLNERFKQTPGVVDIMPSICNHMNIPIPEDVMRELDGVPFIGEIDFSDLSAEARDGKIVLRWKNLSDDADATAEILVSDTNQFKEGGKDQYKKIGEVKIADEEFSFDANSGAAFQKILVDGPHHSMNVWVEKSE